MGNIITNVQLQRGLQDTRSWLGEEDGSFLVRSVYGLLLNNQSNL